MHLLTGPPHALTVFFAALKLFLDDPTASPACIQAFASLTFGYSLASPAFVYPLWHPQMAYSSDRAVSIACGLGAFAYGWGGVTYMLRHIALSGLQVVHALNQKRAKEWTRWLTQVCSLARLGVAACVCVVGFRRKKQSAYLRFSSYSQCICVCTIS